MRHVVDSRMVAHLWANQSQSDARNQQGNFFFRDAIIWSYGSHFPIASHRADAKVKDLITVTTRTYSNTTAKQISFTRQAIPPSKTVLYCHNPLAQSTDEHKRNLEGIAEDIQTTLDKALRSRTQTERLFNQAVRLCEQFNLYRNAFGNSLAKCYSIPHDWKEQTAMRIKAQREAAKLSAQRAKAQAEKRQQELLLALEQWKRGEVTYYNFHSLPVALRRYNTQDNVPLLQTSHGAQIPLDHAKRIWGIVQAIKVSGEPYHHNGHTIHAGSFRVDSIDAEGTLRAGCHVISFEAMKEFADKEGW